MMHGQKKTSKYRIIIFHNILHGHVTWTLILREGYGFRVFENRVLRKMFGPTRAEVTGNWSILHNEDLRDLHSPIFTYSGGEI